VKKERVQDKFLEELRKIPIVQVACERCGLSRQSVYRWRNNDPEFRVSMDRALDEGEELLNDLCESQLLSLVKDKNFQAIKYRLDKRHPKYKKSSENAPEVNEEEVMNKVIDTLGLKAEDFMEENYSKTLVRIADYIHRYGID